MHRYVKFFNAQKGFASSCRTAATGLFVHISAVERAGMSNLNEGQKLSFDVQAIRAAASPLPRTADRLTPV